MHGGCVGVADGFLGSFVVEEVWGRGKGRELLARLVVEVDSLRKGVVGVIDCWRLEHCSEDIARHVGGEDLGVMPAWERLAGTS